jgi:hypothetical protein
MEMKEKPVQLDQQDQQVLPEKKEALDPRDHLGSPVNL